MGTKRDDQMGTREHIPGGAASGFAAAKPIRMLRLLAGLLLMAFTVPPLAPTWNHNGDFSLPRSPQIGGNLEETCFSLAPWGADSWGVEAGSFNSANQTLTAARFAQFGENLYLYGKQQNAPDDFSLGLVRAVQGNVWQDRTLCDAPIPWYIPEPLPLQNDLQLALDYRLDTANLLAVDSAWMMVAVNVWLSSPEFPPGADGRGRKPLVLDLVLYHACNTPGCHLEHFEDEAAFHYQKIVSDNQLRLGHALEWRAALAPHVQDALLSEYACRDEQCTGFPAGLSLDALHLYQLEFVIELRNAEGAALIDNFHLFLPASQLEDDAS